MVRVENTTSAEFSVGRGVRQGCILSPLLFNVYSEHLFKEALDDTEDGLVVNGQIINNLRYADDTVLVADTAEGLQRLVDRVVTACEGYGENRGSTIGRTQTNIVAAEPTCMDWNDINSPIQIRSKQSNMDQRDSQRTQRTGTLRREEDRVDDHFL
ncbi:uncharacterized protein LOC132705138 [Cylas formicarius]|uniref:uncharacterized protein LOC132705138 n=1 Tax=Cylas formicarius TaxID=197179 RepID=UPI0029587F3B|nr:uncharacterized protein LOC132705138 [Cylas formicarius]